jgi:predicted cupin superfamily sugar epimerase
VSPGFDFADFELADVGDDVGDEAGDDVGLDAD